MVSWVLLQLAYTQAAAQTIDVATTNGQEMGVRGNERASRSEPRKLVNTWRGTESGERYSDPLR